MKLLMSLFKVFTVFTGGFFVPKNKKQKILESKKKLEEILKKCFEDTVAGQKCNKNFLTYHPKSFT